MKSERGEPVRGSDPPLVYSSAHFTAGDVSRCCQGIDKVREGFVCHGRSRRRNVGNITTRSSSSGSSSGSLQDLASVVSPSPYPFPERKKKKPHICWAAVQQLIVDVITIPPTRAYVQVVPVGLLVGGITK